MNSIVSQWWVFPSRRNMKSLDTLSLMNRRSWWDFLCYFFKFRWGASDMLSGWWKLRVECPSTAINLWWRSIKFVDDVSYCALQWCSFWNIQYIQHKRFLLSLSFYNLLLSQSSISRHLNSRNHVIKVHLDILYCRSRSLNHFENLNWEHFPVS